MPSHFKPPWKRKKATKDIQEASGGNAQGPGDQSALQLQLAASSEPRVDNPQEAVPVIATRNRNLWEEAFAKLEDTQRDLLSKIEKPQGPNIVEKVAKQTEERYREHEERGWKISRREGKPDINLRAAFRKGLSSVLRFKGLIGAGVAFDPTGHASSAWAIVSLGFQMVQNDADMLKSVFEACGTLAEILARYAAIEVSYRDHTVRDSSHLEDTIVDVYVAILALSAEIVRENSLNIGQRILKSITALADQPLQEFIKTLNSKEETLRRWTDIIQHQYRKREMVEIDEKVTSTLSGIDDLAQQLSKVASKIFTAEDQSILNWLSKYSFSDSHLFVSSRRELHTGEWVLKSLEYEAWKNSGDKMLWLYGNSGCGKSFLCSKIIDDLQSLSKRDSNYILAYWYFTFSNRDSLNIDNLLCSFIKQLCARTYAMPDNVRELWKEHYTAGSRPTRTLLMETLDSVVMMLENAGQETLIVFDAIDEYPLLVEQDSSERQQASGRGDVLYWLRKFCEKHSNVHVLVLSRDEIDIRSTFREAMKMDVAKCVIGDLDSFMQNYVDRIVKERTWKDKYKPHMLSRLEGSSEKRFRWASLVLRRFSDCRDHEKMQEALTKLPNSLEAIYADVLVNKIPKDYMEKARLMFIWLAYSIRPLTLQELACAASLPGPQDVLEICTSSLVTVSREGIRLSIRGRRKYSKEDVVRFDHFSVKEYLTSEHLLASDKTAYFYVIPLVAHLEIAQISVSHLLKTNKFDLATGKGIKAMSAKDSDAELDKEVDVKSETVGAESEWAFEARGPNSDEEEWPPEFAVLDYSTSWYKHIQEADTIEEITDQNSRQQRSQAQSAIMQPDPEFLRSQAHSLFCNKFSQSFKNWFHLLQQSASVVSPLHSLLDTIFFQNLPASPILVASCLDLPDHVQRLLQSEDCVDGDVNSDSASTTERIKPTHAAAIAGSLKVLRLLLEKNLSMEQSDLDMVVLKSHQHQAAVLSTILEFHPTLAITDITVKAAARNYRGDMLEYFLDTPDLVTLSEAVLVDIVEECYGLCNSDELVQKILSRGDDIGCDSRCMMEAFFRHSTCGQNIRLVIEQYKPPPSMSQEVLQWVMDPYVSGYEMLPVILEYYKGIEIEFSQDILVKVASILFNGIELYRTILHPNRNIVITEDVIDGIAGNGYSALYIMDLLMDHETCGTKNFEGVEDYELREAISSHTRTCKPKISDHMMKAAARWDPATIDFLQAHARPNVTFTRHIVETASFSASGVPRAASSEVDIMSSRPVDETAAGVPEYGRRNSF